MWRDWILKLRRQIGMVDLADVIYVHSEYYWQRAEKSQGRELPRLADESESPERAGLSVEPGGRRRPLRRARRPHRAGQSQERPALPFSSLHRQLGYPEVPRMKPADQEKALLPQLARRLEQMETRLKILEEEQRGGLI